MNIIAADQFEPFYEWYRRQHPYTMLVKQPDGSVVTETGFREWPGNYKQLAKIINADLDDDDFMTCMESCVGCIGDLVPAFE